VSAYINSLIASCNDGCENFNHKKNPNLFIFLKNIAKEAWKLKNRGKWNFAGTLANLMSPFHGVLPQLWTLGGIWAP